ncbi:hypothetical protein B0T14DRAFT_219122 [Immersiella caudata]|uniref:Uncharacterized protein n=1 Tax=Immersiella caudata TaxID=314043 RepID=A0AA39WQU1_9PEZI|nr:hypothetical protein B0T14DRAFT_219122 [Immersiella caudata]
MALLNPVHGLVVPFLCVFTIPLAIFAGITTTLAFSVLMFRVAVVYVDIALGLIPHYFTKTRSRILSSKPETPMRRPSRDGHKTPISPASSVGSSSGYSTPTGPSPPYYTPGARMTPGRQSPTTRRRKSSYGFGSALRHSRRSSQVSLASYGTITPIHEDESETPAITESGLTPSVGLDRDFEGIGGWRLDDQDDDGNWTNINSRLELPVERASFTRHHGRSQSLGPVTPNDGVWLAPKSPGARSSHSPEGKGRETIGSSSGTRSPGKGLGPTYTRRFDQHIQLPSALTAMSGEQGYPLISPRTWKKSTP